MMIIHKLKGYTLIELIITMFLISILTLITIPRLDISNHKLKTQAKQLCNDIRMLRAINMTESSVHRILLRESRYSICAGSKTLESKMLYENFEVKCNLDDKNIELTELQFNPDGSLIGSKGCTIIIKDKNKGKYMRMTIMPITGRILLYEEIYK